MPLATRVAIVVWSAVPGLVLGVLAGGGLWVVLQLARQLVPAAAPVLARWGTPLAVLCFVVIPGAAVVAGALEGWLKQR